MPRRARWCFAIAVALLLVWSVHVSSVMAAGDAAADGLAPPSLAGSTREQLRAEVDAFDVRLRALGAAYEVDRLDIAHNDSIQDQESELDRIEAHYEQRFAEQFKAEGMALRNELLRRLNRPPPAEIGTERSVLEEGRLAEPASLSDLADYLSRLAGELP